MMNLAQLYLLAALAVAPSLAADMTLHSPFNLDPQPMDDPKPKFESFYPGVIPATELSGLGKRQGQCASTSSYLCPNIASCCPVGYTCVGDSTNPGCCPNGRICDLSTARCLPGQTDCTAILGVGGCCPTATYKCSNAGGTPGCERLGSSGGSSGSNTSVCDPGSFMCAGGVGCCPNGTTCVPGTVLCRKPCEPGWAQCSFGGCCEPGYSCDATTELCRRMVGSSISRPITTPVSTTSKPATSDTTPVSPPTTISIRPTSTVADSEPTSPPKVDDEAPLSPLNGTESTSTSTEPAPRSTATTRIAPNGSNALKPAGWFGGFGIVFFFVFLHL